jgi:peptide deformylase
MTVREIVFVPNPVLRRKAKAVTQFDDKFQELVDDMIETMRAAPGVGLAAPQIAVLERLIVVEYPETEPDEDSEEEVKPRLYVVVNPHITRKSEDVETGTEGCLSVPGYQGDVERHLAITVKGQNRYGQPLTLKLKDWTARIFQHEIDHLNGILFTDLATKIWKPEGPVEDKV